MTISRFIRRPHKSGAVPVLNQVLCHEDVLGEWMHSSTHINLGTIQVFSQLHAPAALLPGRQTLASLDRRLGEPQSLSGRGAATIFTLPWRWWQQAPPKRCYPNTTLHGVTIQKTWTMNIIKCFYLWLLFISMGTQFVPWRRTISTLHSLKKISYDLSETSLRWL
jgi:hypothetical protein